MKGNRKILAAIAVLLVVIIAATVFMMRQRDNLIPGEGNAANPATAAVAPVAPISTDTAASVSVSTNPAQEQKTMSNFDLTADAEGLSKATATMTLEKGGVIKFKFYSNDAPNTVKRMTQLISEGFYNGIIFHRVVPGFVVQAGDPTGTGTSGSGVKQKAEFNKRKHEPGILSMARTNDPNSADSQFFIMLGTHQHLDGQYTVFGKTIEGYENVPKIQQGDKIKSWTIE